MKTYQLPITICPVCLVVTAAFSQTPPSDIGLTANPVYKNCAKCHAKTAEGRLSGGPTLISEKTASTPTEDQSLIRLIFGSPQRTCHDPRRRKAVHVVRSVSDSADRRQGGRAPFVTIKTSTMNNGLEIKLRHSARCRPSCGEGRLGAVAADSF
jgi:hypothetical protein